MRTQILLLTILLGVFGCSSARMDVDMNLVSIADQYEITKRPGAISRGGGKLIFGPYGATDVDRSFISSPSSGMSVGSISLSVDSKFQKYTYNFKGREHWSGRCEVAAGGTSIGTKSTKGKLTSGMGITGGMHMGIFCNFIAGKENKNPDAMGWNLDFKGQDLISAEGYFKAGSKTVSIVATNKFENSPVPYGKPTGYYFHVKGKVVAGVDVINKSGPVWFAKSLNGEERDAIGLVMVALLLNQV